MIGGRAASQLLVGFFFCHGLSAFVEDVKNDFVQVSVHRGPCKLGHLVIDFVLLLRRTRQPSIQLLLSVAGLGYGETFPTRTTLSPLFT